MHWILCQSRGWVITSTHSCRILHQNYKELEELSGRFTAHLRYRLLFSGYSLCPVSEAEGPTWKDRVIQNGKDCTGQLAEVQAWFGAGLGIPEEALLYVQAGTSNGVRPCSG